MKPLVCQCCGLRFAPRNAGTNRDRSFNLDFCFSCFTNGEFRDHHITIRGMEKMLLSRARRHDELTMEEAYETIKILPDLKRWKMTHVL